MKVILSELSEVPYKVIHHFCKLYPESNLAKALLKGRKYETYAEDIGHLSPWIIMQNFILKAHMRFQKPPHTGSV